MAVLYFMLYFVAGSINMVLVIVLSASLFVFIGRREFRESKGH